MVSQFIDAPTKRHLEVVTQILYYLKSTLGKGLLFKENDQQGVECYADADWASLIKDIKSTTQLLCIAQEYGEMW